MAATVNPMRIRKAVLIREEIWKRTASSRTMLPVKIQYKAYTSTTDLI